MNDMVAVNPFEDWDEGAIPLSKAVEQALADYNRRALAKGNKPIEPPPKTDPDPTPMF